MGVVDEVIIDLSNMSVAELFIYDANPLLVDENASIGVPFRWIQNIGDIVILSRFPSERIRAS